MLTNEKIVEYGEAVKQKLQSLVKGEVSAIYNYENYKKEKEYMNYILTSIDYHISPSGWKFKIDPFHSFADLWTESMLNFHFNYLAKEMLEDYTEYILSKYLSDDVKNKFRLEN
jgi:hypothetical protein